MVITAVLSGSIRIFDVCTAIMVPILIACGNPEGALDRAPSDVAVSPVRHEAELGRASSDLAVSPMRLDFERTSTGDLTGMFVVVTNSGK